MNILIDVLINVKIGVKYKYFNNTFKKNGKKQLVPRHREIDNSIAKPIKKYLGIDV